VAPGWLRLPGRDPDRCFCAG